MVGYSQKVIISNFKLLVRRETMKRYVKAFGILPYLPVCRLLLDNIDFIAFKLQTKLWPG
jgi:hypothetical protein